MGNTHRLSLHPIPQSLGLCDDGWDGDIHFLRFYLILIYALEHIRYVVTSSLDVRNMFTLIFSFGDIVDNYFTEPSVTCNMTCAMKSCRM